MSGETITVDAEKMIKAIEKVERAISDLRKVLAPGVFRQVNAREPDRGEGDPEPLNLAIDISGIDWRIGKYAEGKKAGEHAPYAWAFGFNQDGSIKEEASELVKAIEQYGVVKVGNFLIKLVGADGKLLNRSIPKKKK